MGCGEDPEPIARPGSVGRAGGGGVVGVHVCANDPTAQQMRSHLCFSLPRQGRKPFRGARNCALSHDGPAAEERTCRAPIRGAGNCVTSHDGPAQGDAPQLPGSTQWNAHVPASGIAAATNFPFAAALSSASRSRSSRGCRPIDPTGAANSSTCWCLLAAARQLSATWSAWCACHQATGDPPRCPAGARRAVAPWRAARTTRAAPAAPSSARSPA